MKSYKSLDATCHTTFVDARVVVVSQKDRKVKSLTNVTILREDVILATTTLAGEYTEAQALQEYIKLLDKRLNKDAAKAWKINDEHNYPVETETYSGIWLGDVLVADCNLPGYYTPAAAFEDFQINRKEWKFRYPGTEMAKAAGLLGKKVEEVPEAVIG